MSKTIKVESTTAEVRDRLMRDEEKQIMIIFFQDLGDYVTIAGISQFGITTKFRPRLLIWNIPSMLEYRV
ncbi:hypothetical protein Clacol_009121 [Clathrus columnatus]|uniref:Uncharacterized protein n=1 Tax=Clathrus columnatus TaxID=1419009 RepID=A0AAV5AMW4_9AGAM|nr:hypothetical protein Clacol_009121 [Clathrus columnatus]